MTSIDTPILTLPPRGLTKSPQWRIDDTVLVGDKRWIIRTLNIWWRTTLDKLPEKIR